MANPLDQSLHSEIVLYQTEDGQTRIQVRLENETVWLTQADTALQSDRRIGVRIGVGPIEVTLIC